MFESAMAVGAATVLVCIAAAGESPVNHAIDNMPEGCHLQAYDDCGVPDRQPHVVKAPDTTVYTYGLDQVACDEKGRTVVTNPKQVDAIYEGLNPNLDYVVAVVYANEPFNNRIQSLWAGNVQLHGPHALPKGKAERLLFRVPRSATGDGKLALHFKREGEVNVVVSVIELWAAAPSPKALYLSGVSGLATNIEGRALDLAYRGIVGADVELRYVGKETIAKTQTGAGGGFMFDRSLFEKTDKREPLEIVARFEGSEVHQTLAVDDLYFDPIRYWPMPSSDKDNCTSLNGPWRINTKPAANTREEKVDKWGLCNVPGQWRQQGYDVALDQHVAMAREFTIPAAWAGKRMFLRFEAVHAGTRYWLNGKELGYSENLFTPVEWEITQHVKPGETNRLDLDMVVDTVSEKLSYSCGYAFHNLGGIDRSVWLYALPQTNIRSFRIYTGLDRQYQNGKLVGTVEIDNPSAQKFFQPGVALFDANNKPVTIESSRMKTPFENPVSFIGIVKSPSQWSAEKPVLYKLVFELKDDVGNVIQRVERMIGFRTIDVRDKQLYVNGQRVKLAGACHHELDPLTGRADTARHAEEDVALLKGANLNYIRTSHYPPTHELLDAADRLGMYVEVEAPFCWVAPSQDLTPLKQILTPTSAMVDYCRDHPSVIMWSLANESSFNRFFEISNKVVKQLDPTRPTTFNNPDPKRICDIANLHYPNMPYDDQIRDDPRPVFLGEYFFPVCHEQTDVMIDPGLRELWGHGHSNPDSDWGKYCAASFKSPYTHPGTPPGAWTHIYHSNRIIGGAIWAAIDEPYYLPDGQKVGYAWHHGFWGLIDAWRRPKPEWWLAKNIFSPVWFPVREVPFSPGQKDIRIPVENRYSFTNLNELTFTCTFQGQALSGPVFPTPGPGQKGPGVGNTGPLQEELVLPVLPAMKSGDLIRIQVSRKTDEQIVDAWITLGHRLDLPVPHPASGPPSLDEQGNLAVITANKFTLVFDKARGDFKAEDPRHTAQVTGFPRVHLTRFDFGDLAPGPPYAVLPDAASRVVDRVAIEKQPEGLAVVVHDHYADFAGYTRWLIDSKGVGTVSYDYTYSGGKLNAREIGIRFVLRPDCDELQWRRWSEWGDFPSNVICRAAGTAKAHRDPSLGKAAENQKPSWPWSLDETDLGTTDFRSIKFNIYEAALRSPAGAGLEVHANADAHVSACLDSKGVLLHVLSECRLGPTVLNNGDHVKGEFGVCIMP